MSYRNIFLTALAVLSASVFPLPCSAATDSMRDLLSDAGSYFTAPLHWNQGNWEQFAVSVAAIAAAHQYDDKIRDHFVSSPSEALTGKDPYETRDFAPAAAMFVGTWALAAVLRDRDGYEEGRTMMESGALTLLSSELVKVAAGRLRPNETTSVDDWRKSGSAFPSMHTSLAFAVGTVLAESGNDNDRWVRRAIGYGLATYTGYLRVKHNAHWLSDNVASAAIGIATAQFTMNRHDDRRKHLSATVIPTNGGAMLVFWKQLK